MRYHPAVLDVKVEALKGAITWGPGTIEPTHHLDLSWYGIHPVELLYTLMGPGCQSVSRTYTEGADISVGLWKNGRIGAVHSIREGKRGTAPLSMASAKSRSPTVPAQPIRKCCERS